MLEGKQGSGDEGLSKFIAEIRSPVGGFDEDVEGRLVEPGAGGQRLLPGAFAAQAGVGSHIHRRAGQWQRAFPPRHAVADLTAGAGRSPVEGLYCGGEVVRLRFEGDDRLVLLLFIRAGPVGCAGCKLLHLRAAHEGHIIFISRDDAVGVGLGGLFDEGEKRAGLLYPIDDESAVENLMPTMLAIDLRKAEYF